MTILGCTLISITIIVLVVCTCAHTHTIYQNVQNNCATMRSNILVSHSNSTCPHTVLHSSQEHFIILSAYEFMHTLLFLSVRTLFVCI